MPLSDPRTVRLYHITHTRHLASIVETGLLCDRDAQSGGHLQIEIGQPSIKERRRTVTVRVGPGGVIPDYVPFYFAPRSPMLFKIARRGFPEYTEGEDPILHLVTDVGTILDHGLRFILSDGNCASVLSEQFADLAQLDRVDWDIMDQRIWRDTPEDPDRMRRRMAEFLVHGTVPWGAIRKVVAKTEEIASRARMVLAESGSPVAVSVEPEWYYG